MRHPVTVCKIGQKDQAAPDPDRLERIRLLAVTFQGLLRLIGRADIFTRFFPIETFIPAERLCLQRGDFSITAYCVHVYASQKAADIIRGQYPGS